MVTPVAATVPLTVTMGGAVGMTSPVSPALRMRVSLSVAVSTHVLAVDMPVPSVGIRHAHADFTDHRACVMRGRHVEARPLVDIVELGADIAPAGHIDVLRDIDPAHFVPGNRLQPLDDMQAVRRLAVAGHRTAGGGGGGCRGKGRQ